MTISTDFQDGICHLYFSGEITARTRAETDAQMIDALRRYHAFDIDLSGVDAIDESGVRLMLWMKRIGGRVVHFSKVPPAVQQALERPT